MLEIILETAKRSNENVLIEGVHGIGKSLRVKEYAKKNNLHLEILYLSHQEVGDLIGIPMVSNNTTIWTKPSWLTRMETANKKGQGCILFLDELNRAQRDVRQTALQITLEKRLHDHILPSIDGIETLVIAAINPEDDQKIDYQVDELDVALKDRFLYYEMKLDVKSWLDWARENNIIDEITSFISDYPDRLFYFTQESTYPTPRSWAKLSELLLKAPKLKTNELKTIIFGKLGQTIGSQFYSYYKDFSNMITIKNIEEFILEQTSFSNQEISIKLKNSLLADKSKIWLSEMAQKLFKKYIGDKNNQKVLMTYLDSIDLEILASFFTNIKEQNENSLAKFILLENGREIINKIADKIEF